MSEVTAEMLIGTSCTLSARRVAVTMMTSPGASAGSCAGATASCADATAGSEIGARKEPASSRVRIAAADFMTIVTPLYFARPAS
jgi:hypothetical protein